MKEDLLYEQLYERTIGFGRTQFVRELMNYERKNKELNDRIDKTNQKLELLLKDLKINSEEEKETGKSYFNTNMFAIRIKEISKTLNGESNEQ